MLKKFQDRCMELREETGSGNMLSVEKKLERQKAKAEHRMRQIANASERVSVFDFINSKLTKTSGQDSKEGLIIKITIQLQSSPLYTLLNIF